jgi:hypothetical protein
LIHRPDLAVKIDQLRIGWFVEGSTSRIQKPCKRLPLHGTLAEMFEKRLWASRRSKPEYRGASDIWLKDLQNGDEAAEDALLLTMLPNLRFLRIESRRDGLGNNTQELHDALSDPRPTSWIIEFGEGMLRERPVELQPQSQQPPQIFKTSEVLSLWSACDGTRSLQWYVNLLALPSLTSFYSRYFEEQWSFKHSLLKPDMGVTPLQHITLVHCKLGGLAIEEMLTECTTLRSLTLNS